MQRQRVACAVSWDLVRWHLEGMYGAVEEGMDKDGVATMRVSKPSQRGKLEWGADCG